MADFNRLVTQLMTMLLVVTAPVSHATLTFGSSRSVEWRRCLSQPEEWYSSADALRIADNVVLYQRSSGGWPKNIDMARTISLKQKSSLLDEKQRNDSTIDNGATYTQISFLARVYRAQPRERHKSAAIKGVDYLLNAQYPNGGWPQFYPHLTGYQRHITFNDGAMIGVMTLLRDIAARKPGLAFTGEDRGDRAREAVRRGIECILRTQVVVQGKPTVWCAQYDEVTLAPAPARTYELVSLCSAESAGIVQFLMSVDPREERINRAVESAVDWFRKSKIDGIRWVTKQDASRPGGVDRVVVADPNAPPLWARFYEIGTDRPIFAGRDGILKYSVAEIEHERRIHYQWYVTAPAALLERDYPAWRKESQNGASSRSR